MKKTRKLLSLVLALALALAMSMTAMAAETGTITVNNATIGQDYSIYKILDLSYSAPDHYAYTIATGWEEFFQEAVEEKGIKAGAGAEYVDVKDGYVYWKKGKDDEKSMKAFTEAALAYADEKKIGAVKTEHAESETLTFKDVLYGYYLMKSTVGTILTLDTVTPNVSIIDKNKQPTLEKEVEEDSNSTWGKVNDADIGQTVNYRVTIDAKAGAENYVMHDVMSEGLTFNGTVKVTKSNEEVLEKGNYQLVTEGLKDGCTFEVRFTKEFCDGLTDTDTIVIEYSATVNKKAIIAGANPNTSTLKYGEDNNLETEQNTTNTYVWSVNVFKYAGEDEKTPLAGAEFTLSKNEDGSAPYNLVPLTEDELKAVNDAAKLEGDAAYTVGYRVAKEGESTTSEFVTPDNGKVYIEGLDADTYYLTETEAPDGYNKLPGPIKVEVTSTQSKGTDELGVEVKYQLPNTEDMTSAPNGTISVLNQTGAQLPSTGGIGTTIFYVIGGILVIGAAILLISRRRTDAE